MTLLTGTIYSPGGTAVTGSLYLQLSQDANLTGSGGWGAVSAIPPYIFNLTAGAISGPGAGPYSVNGADVLTPSGLTYHMSVTGPAGELVLERDISITGTTVNLGTVVSVNAASLPSPFVLGGDVIGPPTSTTVGGIRNQPISAAVPTLGQNLNWNGSVWLPTTPAPGPLPGLGPLTADWTAGNFRIDFQNSTRWFNVMAYGAVGNGIVDDSAAIQAALSAANAAGGGTVYAPPGTYICLNLVIYSNTILLGDGWASVFKLSPAAGITDLILKNATPATFTDTNIALRGMKFDGNNAGAGGTQTRFTEAVSFSRVTNLSAEDCWFTNVQYIHLAMGGVRRVVLANNLFTVCGYQGTTTNAGGPLYAASEAGTDNTIDAQVVRNRFIDNYCGFIFSVQRGVFSNNVIHNCQGGIFSARGATDPLSQDITYSGNVFDTITPHSGMSATALETGAYRTTITGNTFHNIADNAIAMTDVQNATVTGNTIVNPSQSGSGTGNAGISILGSLASPHQPRNILIQGNNIEDDTGAVLADAAIQTALIAGSVTACSNIVIRNNYSSAAWVSGQNIKVGVGSLDSTCEVIDHTSPRVMFTQTADSTTTANTLTTLFGTGVGTLTLPANFLTAGRAIRIKMGGYISVVDGSDSTKTLTLSLGGTTVATGTSIATLASLLNQDWRAEATITCRTTGAPGTVQASGRWETQVATSNMLGGVDAISTAATSITTTSALAIDLKYNNAYATGTVTTTWATVEALN